MSNKDLLDNIKKLREMTGVGFKDCKVVRDGGQFMQNIKLLSQHYAC